MEKYRLYFLVHRSLSGIQQGIQCGHAALEYAIKYSDDKDFKRFSQYDKTWVILNGGVSNHYYHDFKSEGKYLNTGWHKVNYDENDSNTIGTMEQHWNFLQENKIKSVFFLEPDANNMMTSICFLVPNDVFNKKENPDFPSWINRIESITDIDKIKLREIYFGINEHKDSMALYTKTFNQWSNTLGGIKYGNLRVFLNNFKLA